MPKSRSIFRRYLGLTRPAWTGMEMCDRSPGLTKTWCEPEIRESVHPCCSSFFRTSAKRTSDANVHTPETIESAHCAASAFQEAESVRTRQHARALRGGIVHSCRAWTDPRRLRSRVEKVCSEKSRDRSTNLSAIQCFSVSVFQCFSVSVFQCFSVSVFQCFSVSVFQCFSVSVFQCFSVSVFQCFSVSVFQCFSVSVFQFVYQTLYAPRRVVKNILQKLPEWTLTLLALV
jgi:hypothetical protein